MKTIKNIKHEIKSLEVGNIIFDFKSEKFDNYFRYVERQLANTINNHEYKLTHSTPVFDKNIDEILKNNALLLSWFYKESETICWRIWVMDNETGEEHYIYNYENTVKTFEYIKEFVVEKSLNSILTLNPASLLE